MFAVRDKIRSGIGGFAAWAMLGFAMTSLLLVCAWNTSASPVLPKTDANDGLDGDNPYFQRWNVARAHTDGTNSFWYTSNYQIIGEPNPSGNQWVDYKPPLSVLGAGWYRITATYRKTNSRADYGAKYIVYHSGGTTTITQSQFGYGDEYVSFVLGDFDLGGAGWVRAQDTGTGSITFNEMSFTYLGQQGDSTPPSVPTNVRATGQSSSSIKVTWTASTDNVGVTGYKVFRNGVQVVATASTSYTDTGLSPSTTYSYTVSAYDAVGNNSAQSSPSATARTYSGDTEAPSVPTNVVAIALSTTSIRVTWTASTDNVAVKGYYVYRNGNYLATSTTTTFTNNGLTPNTVYSYTVAAYDASRNVSAQSSPPVTATTMAAINIDDAKALADSTAVGMVSKTVTAIYSGCLYIEEADKYMGIKVVPSEMPGGLSVGGVVDIGGTMQTQNGERYIADAVVL